MTVWGIIRRSLDIFSTEKMRDDFIGGNRVLRGRRRKEKAPGERFLPTGEGLLMSEQATAL